MSTSKEKVNTSFDAETSTSADPFYSESNIRHLQKIVRDIKEGKAHFVEHEMIEEDEPTEDELRAIREAEADTSPTIPHEEIDWD